MKKFLFYLIRLFPPEFSHMFTLNILKTGLIRVFVNKTEFNPIIRQVIWNIEFNNPIGLAAGFDKNAFVIDETLNLGFGFVEIGTITPQPQKGNKKPRVFRLSKDKGIINFLGFNNNGIDKIEKRLKKRILNRYLSPGVLGINIGKNYFTKEIDKDYAICLQRLGIYADYIAVNISSPNTEGLRDLQNRNNLEKLIISLKKIKNSKDEIKDKPLLIKISPDINEEQKKDIALTSLAQGIDGLIISNSTLSRPDSLMDKYKNKKGGLSGKPLHYLSNKLIKEMFNLTGGKIPIIGVGGVNSGRDAYEKIKAGASLVQIYTGLVFEGPDISNKINKEIISYLHEDGYSNISEAIGKDL